MIQKYIVQYPSHTRMNEQVNVEKMLDYLFSNELPLLASAFQTSQHSF